MVLIQAFRTSGTELSAQRTKMNVVAENLANSETTRTADGGPYKRKMVVFEAAPAESFKSALDASRNQADGVKVAEIVESDDDFRLVYNPSHPDADPATGYVAMPNVNHLTEIADMMTARRAYDANVTAITNTKAMVLKALEIGK